MDQWFLVRQSTPKHWPRRKSGSPATALAGDETERGAGFSIKGAAHRLNGPIERRLKRCDKMWQDVTRVILKHIETYWNILKHIETYWNLGRFLELQIEYSAAAFFAALLWKISLFAFKERRSLHVPADKVYMQAQIRMMILLGHVFEHLQASFRAEIWDFIRQSMQKNCLKIILNRCLCLVSSEAASCHHANRKIKAGQFIIRTTGDHKHSRTFKNHSSYITIAHIDQNALSLGALVFRIICVQFGTSHNSWHETYRKAFWILVWGAFILVILCYLNYITMFGSISTI